MAWPYYLKDLAGFTQVYDASLPGAGNLHICSSTIWTLENIDFSPTDTLIIVMFSGNNRDDCVIAPDFLNDYPVRFMYSPNVASGITGGNHDKAGGNTVFANTIGGAKTDESRSVENYIYAISLYHYLKQKNYQFQLLNYIDHAIPNLASDFDITPFLARKLRKKYQKLFASGIENIYKFALKHDLLEEDNFHPSPNGHLRWTRECLVPFLQFKYGP